MNEDTPNTISHPVLINLNTKVEELTAKLENAESLLTAKTNSYDYVYKQLSERGNAWRLKEAELEAKLKELLDDEEISPENATAIADIFNISLTTQITIEYNIIATATIEVPYGADADEVADCVYVERVEFYTDYANADVLESDHDISDWNVR